MRRILFVVLATLACWLGFSGSATAPVEATPAPITTYTYDIHAHPADSAHTPTKRGSPADDVQDRSAIAGDLGSRGAVARSGPVAPSDSPTYDDHFPLAPGARVTGPIDAQRTGGGIGAVLLAGPSAIAANAGAPVGRRVVTKTFTDEAGNVASQAKYGWEMKVAPGTNAPAVIGGRSYSGHALDQMQGRGIVPSAVDDAIGYGVSVPSRGGTTVYYSSANDLSVVVNSEGRVVTTSFGDLR